MQITAAALIAAGLAAGIGALIALHLAPTGLSALRGFYLGMTAWLVTVAVLLTLPAHGRPEHHFIGAARLQAAAIHPGRVCLTKPAGIGGGLSAASLSAIRSRSPLMVPTWLFRAHRGAFANSAALTYYRLPSFA